MKYGNSNNLTTNQGFTIAELLIATAVFSLVLLLGLTGFIQVGKMFFKGIAITQTQSAVSNVYKIVTEDLHRDKKVLSEADGGGGTKRYCIDRHRYTYFVQLNPVNINQIITNAASWTQSGIVLDTLPVAGGCPDPLAAGNNFYSDSKQLLNDGMILGAFDLNKINLYADIEPFIFTLNLQAGFGALTDFSFTPSMECRNFSTINLCGVTTINTNILGDPSL